MYYIVYISFSSRFILSKVKFELASFILLINVLFKEKFIIENPQFLQN